MQIYQYFEFMNSNLYAVKTDENGGADIDYLLTYGLLTGVFLALIIFILFSGKVWKTVKQDGIKDGSRHILQVLSCCVLLAVKLYQIPFTTVVFQSFICEEDPILEYSMSTI
jgi:hypothetical protein